MKSSLGLNQLLGDELLEPFDVDAARKMDVTGGPFTTGCNFLVGGPDEPQKTVCLTLEGRDRDRP